MRMWISISVLTVDQVFGCWCDASTSKTIKFSYSRIGSWFLKAENSSAEIKGQYYKLA